jgi:hypothetical protein
MQVTVIVWGTIGLMAGLRFVRRILEMRHERLLRTPPADVMNRLDRIEMMVETTAVEVERIAEANRFVAKLLAERQGTAIPLPKTPERVITPH